MIKKILTMILVAACVVALVYGALELKKQFQTDEGGSITISLKALDGNVISSKKISFNEGDTLRALIESNFNNVRFDNGMLMDIESLSTPSDWSSYICVYKNGVMSEVGIEQIEFVDGDSIELVMTAYSF